MAHTQLPLQFRIAIRDTWENTESPIQTALKELDEVIGIPVSIQFQWPMLWAQLEKRFPDKTVFVPAINSLISAWQQALKAKLEEEDNTAWSDQFLEAIMGQSSLTVRVEANTQPRPALAWHKATSSILLKVPDCAPPYSPSPTAVFNTQLQTLFDPISDEEIDEEWADVTNEPSGRKKAPNPSAMPSLDTLSRPELLFANVAPYHMVLRHTAQSLTIEGSHQPSLELLCAYFKKWTKSMQYNSEMPRLQITLKESSFGLGVLYDALLIEPSGNRQTWIHLNPILVISFIEYVLRYQMVPTPMGVDGMYFRREEVFA